jgi:hypothetical protein
VPPFLARSASPQKWKSETAALAGKVPADAVFADMRTIDNRISFWACDPSQESSLKQTVLAVATAKDHVQRVDLVWISEEELAKIDIATEATLGETPAKSLATGHRDLVDLDLEKLYGLSKTFASAMVNKQTRRFTEAQVREIILKGVEDGIVSAQDLKKSVADKIKK